MHTHLPFSPGTVARVNPLAAVSRCCSGLSSRCARGGPRKLASARARSTCRLVVDPSLSLPLSLLIPLNCPRRLCRPRLVVASLNVVTWLAEPGTGKEDHAGGGSCFQQQRSTEQSREPHAALALSASFSLTLTVRGSACSGERERKCVQ